MLPVIKHGNFEHLFDYDYIQSCYVYYQVDYFLKHGFVVSFRYMSSFIKLDNTKVSDQQQ